MKKQVKQIKTDKKIESKVIVFHDAAYLTQGYVGNKGETHGQHLRAHIVI